MINTINLNEIYDHNINILIGSGASFPAIPTLKLELKQGDTAFTIETLAQKLEQLEQKESLKTLLFMYYYENCIKKCSGINNERKENDNNTTKHETTMENYKEFLQILLQILNRRKPDKHKSINIFTTNYDGYLEHSSDKLLQKRNDFVINDGTSGFFTRHLNVHNFDSYVFDTGVFKKYTNYKPQLNLIHLHGSIYWQKNGVDKITVDYKNFEKQIEIQETQLKNFSALIQDKEKTFEDLIKAEFSIDKEHSNNFWQSYNQLPIVNPTKWKFHETVFEEHYYQMLRFMGYELEKNNSILITFGFSFADEHILNLVKRSLSNPTLKVFIVCYDETTKDSINEKFKGYNNITYIVDANEKLDFKKFNEKLNKGINRLNTTNNNVDETPSNQVDTNLTASNDSNEGVV